MKLTKKSGCSLQRVCVGEERKREGDGLELDGASLIMTAALGQVRGSGRMRSSCQVLEGRHPAGCGPH